MSTDGDKIKWICGLWLLGLNFSKDIWYVWAKTKKNSAMSFHLDAWLSSCRQRILFFCVFWIGLVLWALSVKLLTGYLWYPGNSSNPSSHLEQKVFLAYWENSLLLWHGQLLFPSLFSWLALVRVLLNTDWLPFVLLKPITFQLLPHHLAFASSWVLSQHSIQKINKLKVSTGTTGF